MSFFTKFAKKITTIISASFPQSIHPSLNVLIKPYYVVCRVKKRTRDVQTQYYLHWKTNELKWPLRVVFMMLFIHKKLVSWRVIGPAVTNGYSLKCKGCGNIRHYLFIYSAYLAADCCVFSVALLAYCDVIRAKNIQIRVGSSWNCHCCLTKLNCRYATSMPFVYSLIILPLHRAAKKLCDKSYFFYLSRGQQMADYSGFFEIDYL